MTHRDRNSWKVVRGMVAVIILAAMLTWAAPAGAAIVYRTIQVKPARNAPALFATVESPGNQIGNRVVLATRSGGNALQEWWFGPVCWPGCAPVAPGGGGGLPRAYEVKMKLVNRASGKCMAIRGATRANGSTVEIQTCSTNARHQVWKPAVPPDLPIALTGGGHRLETQLRDYHSGIGATSNADTMRCVNVTDARFLPGTPLEIQGCQGGLSQSFILVPALRDNRPGARPPGP